MSLYLPPALSAPTQGPFHSLPPPSSVRGSQSPSLCSNVLYPWALLGALRWSAEQPYQCFLSFCLFSPLHLPTPDTLFLTLQIFCIPPPTLAPRMSSIRAGTFCCFAYCYIPSTWNSSWHNRWSKKYFLSEWLGFHKGMKGQYIQLNILLTLKNEDVTSVEKNFRYSQY